MIINHNLMANNALRNMNINSGNAAKSMQKLSSGLRINTAADDAAGLAISEKMRGQIRGLDQASANSQDGISLVQTAEGALSETQSILQRMRELAVQAGNDTNVSVDRSEIQKEMNQLSSEINRIGNTTEFNTKALLKGDGSSNLANSSIINETVKLDNGADAFTTEAKRTDAVTTASASGDAITYTINGQALTLNFLTDSALTATTSEVQSDTVTATSATIGINGATVTTSQATSMAEGLQSIIDKNEVLKDNYKVTVSGSSVVIEAIKGGEFEGSKGTIAAASGTGASDLTNTVGSTNLGSHTAAVASTTNIDLAALDTDAEIEALVGKGMTINGQQIEFYNANDGAYAGDAIGVNISDSLAAAATFKDEALATTIAAQLGSKLDGVTVKVGTATNTIDITAKTAGLAGDNIEIKDGGVQKSFEATLQVGANKGQGFKIDINDMRSIALEVTGTAGADATEGAKFTAANTVTNGTDSTVREAALDVSTYENATAAVKVINNAIESVSSERSKLGAFQNRLEHTIANLGTSSENLTSAESRIRDVDMAKEMSNFSKNNILSQAAQAMLAQANNQPQQVLQLLR